MRFDPFEERRTKALGVLTPRADMRLKQYSIVYGDAAFDAARFSDGLALAWAALPEVAEAQGRPGVGFLICHQGLSGDYVVVGWWDRQNELPIRVFIRADDGWREARGGESFCVWDLAVIWHERNAYINHVMTGADIDLDAYLAETPGLAARNQESGL